MPTGHWAHRPSPSPIALGPPAPSRSEKANRGRGDQERGRSSPDGPTHGEFTVACERRRGGASSFPALVPKPNHAKERPAAGTEFLGFISTTRTSSSRGTYLPCLQIPPRPPLVLHAHAHDGKEGGVGVTSGSSRLHESRAFRAGEWRPSAHSKRAPARACFLVLVLVHLIHSRPHLAFCCIVHLRALPLYASSTLIHR